jgi:hypothetical protein
MQPVSPPDSSRCATRRACARQRDNAPSTTVAETVSAGREAAQPPIWPRVLPVSRGISPVFLPTRIGTNRGL